MKQFFFREPSEIIWRLKKINELQIKKKMITNSSEGSIGHLIVSIRASLQDKIDFYLINDKKKSKLSWNYWNFLNKVFHPFDAWTKKNYTAFE